MEVIVLGLIVPDLESAYQQDTRHRGLRRLLDAGSHCTVNGVAAGLAGVEEILAAAAQMPSSPIHEAREVSGQDGLRILGEVLELGEAEEALTQWDELGGRVALCVAVGDQAGRRAPVAIIDAESLPSMGPMPPCELRDLQATWVRLAGGTPAAGRYLLEETAASWDPELEQQLTERLRQLYGD